MIAWVGAPFRLVCDWSHRLGVAHSVDLLWSGLLLIRSWYIVLYGGVDLSRGGDLC